MDHIDTESLVVSGSAGKKRCPSCGVWLFYCLLLLLVLGWSGCSEPDGIGRFRATPVTNIILDSLGVVEEEPGVFEQARDPRPEDLIPSTDEYVINAGDVLAISIFELFAAGTEWTAEQVVSEAGRITLPEIGSVMAAGRTEQELTRDIEGLLSPDVLRDPKVRV